MQKPATCSPHRTPGPALRIALSLLAALWLGTAAAQGGPPLVTDDPETPGDGRWEVNLGNIGARTSGSWLISAVDADINYGWGDRVQLKFDTPWNAARQGQDWTSGLGTSLLGVKWRFLDAESGGWSASTYPQVSVNLAPGSAARGLATPGHSFFLPLESATRLGAFDLDLEMGHSWSSLGEGEWIAGAILARAIAKGGQIMLETRLRHSTTQTATLVNLGSRIELSPALTLLGAVGREFGAADSGRQSVLYYLGVQVVR